MIRYLTVAQVVSVHDHVQPGPIRDIHALTSAVMQPQASWDGNPMYPTVLDQGAVLLRGLALAHAFLDGNKRTAWASSQLFLAMNGVPLYDVPPLQATDFVVSVVEAHVEVLDIATWFRDRLKR